MADENVQTTQQGAADTATETITSDVSLLSKLQASAFGGEETQQSAQQQQDNASASQQQQGDQTQQQQAQGTDEEILDEDAYKKTYFKNKWGFDNEEAFEKEVNTWKEKANQQSFSWKNDDSKKVAEAINEGKLDELYNYLHTQKTIEKLSTANIADRATAAELVKFGIQKDNPNLTADEVEFLFDEKYALPEKPKQGDVEDNEDYAARVTAWQAQVNNIEKRLVIEAKMQQPKMAQLKSELVLPTIQKENQQQQQVSQEDLAKFQKLQNDFLLNSKQAINNFNGFSIQVKDKDVDYTVNYAPSKEEKSFVENKMQAFSEGGFDANAIFADRWLNQDGTINNNQMQEDLFRLYGGSKYEQKLAMDSANKRLEAYLKEKKQIDLSGNQNRGTFLQTDIKSDSEKLQEAAWGN